MNYPYNDKRRNGNTVIIPSLFKTTKISQFKAFFTVILH